MIPTKHDPIWTAIYAAAFVRETHDAIARGHGWDDEGVDRAMDEAEACADWELERRVAKVGRLTEIDAARGWAVRRDQQGKDGE